MSPVFYPAVIVIVIFVIAALLFSEPLEQHLSWMQEQLFINFAWFSMLFTAGMGSGILFFGVAEPVTHFNPDYALELRDEDWKYNKS